ncbi:MAG: hypothetical protein QXM27_00455 [Candidatus Pacearchaeota archaeon]
MIKKILVWIVLAIFAIASIASVYAQQYREQERLREQLREIKTELTKCINNESTYCKEVRTRAYEIVKERFCNGINIAIERIEKIKKDIDKQKDLDEEEKNIIKEQLNETIEVLKKQKENCEKADTPQKLKQILEEHKRIREQFRERERFGLEKVRERRIGLIIVKAEKLVDKLYRFLEKYNVSDPELEKLIENFKEKIELANKSRQEAITLWEELHKKIKNKEVNSTEIRETVREIHEKLDEAKNYLEEAKRILKEIIFKIKGIEREETENKTIENKTS